MMGKIIAGYLGIGVLVLAGPGRVEVRKQRDSAYPRDPFLRERLGWKPVPEWMPVVVGVIVAVVLVLLWPVFLASWFKEGRSGRHGREWWEEHANERMPKGLTFGLMGGAGTIFCRDCGYEEAIISFTHGYTAEGRPRGTIGHQCQSCGKFSHVDDHGGPLSAAALRCECGGGLEREAVLFCPRCRSTNLGYERRYIT